MRIFNLGLHYGGFLTPEQKARTQIDQMLNQAGWLLQDFKELNLSAGFGIAVREYPVESGWIDYALFINRRPVGLIEAKKQGHTLSQVHEQTTRYSSDKLKYLLKAEDLRFLYESTGAETYFSDARDPVCRQREVFSFHRPETLDEWLQDDKTLRGRLKSFPVLTTDGFRECQLNAIRNLETSFGQNKPKALIQMATGAGKTYTAITAAYRLIKYAHAKRILFLVDTRNLGKQAEQEFQAYKPYDDNKRLFPELYTLQRLRSGFIDPSAQVCISTIQRMYSILKGKEMDESLEDDSPYESKLLKEKPVEVVYNSAIPIETFDFIIIDECHRSIYNLWRQVLDYFDAFMIGLTATPDKRTFAFFHENVVSEYTLKQSVADKVNVGYDVYTIETKITSQGAKIEAKQYVDLRNKMTRRKEWKQLEDEVNYQPSQLDRDVVNPSTIRHIIREYKRVLKEEFFPERGENAEVPKTLIFAKTDSHAEDIVHIVREEFGENNDFCKKITYNVKNEDPESILQQFRTQYSPRIAVTVDMIATGTDVKPIEVLIFMRDVRSRNYFQQMIGRGTRSFSKDELLRVTPSAKVNKERFYIIDAVHVFKSVKVDYPVIDKKPTVPLKDLMRMATLQPDEDNLSSLSSRLTRLERQMSDSDKNKFKEYTGGKELSAIANELADVYDPDMQVERARTEFKLKPEEEPTEKQVKDITNRFSIEAVKPFDNPGLRNFIEKVRSTIYQVIDTVNIDKVIHSGFDVHAKENAEEIINDFRKFIEKNKDQITALRILYSQPERRKDLTYQMVKELHDALIFSDLSVEKVWNAYQRTKPSKVKQKSMQAILTDIVSLIRYELKIDKRLEPYSDIVNRNFKKWVFKRNAGPVQFTEAQMEWLRMIKDYIATSVHVDTEAFDYTPFIDKGGLGMMWKLFGERMEKILSELNEELAA